MIAGTGVGIAYGVPVAVAARWFPDTGTRSRPDPARVRVLRVIYGKYCRYPHRGFRGHEHIQGLRHRIHHPDRPARTATEIPCSRMETCRMDTSCPGSRSGSHLRIQTGADAEDHVILCPLGLLLHRLPCRADGDRHCKARGYRCGVEAGLATMLVGVFAIFNGFGRPVFGTLTDKLTPRNTAMLSFVLIALASLLIWQLPPFLYTSLRLPSSGAAWVAGWPLPRLQRQVISAPVTTHGVTG